MRSHFSKGWNVQEQELSMGALDGICDQHIEQHTHARDTHARAKRQPKHIPPPAGHRHLQGQPGSASRARKVELEVIKKQEGRKCLDIGIS